MRYNPDRYKEYYQENREKKIAQVSEYQKRNRLDRREYEHDRYLKIKEEVINHYGGKCNCCGETEHAFLQIDHINGNGNAHRREIQAKYHGRVPMALWVKRNGFPEEYQILCANCNNAKAIYGICPHQANLQSEQK